MGNQVKTVGHLGLPLAREKGVPPVPWSVQSPGREASSRAERLIGFLCSYTCSLGWVPSTLKGTLTRAPQNRAETQSVGRGTSVLAAKI